MLVSGWAFAAAPGRWEDDALTLVGTAVQKRSLFDVYRISLELESESADAEEILASNQIKRIRLVMLRSGKRQQIAKALSDGLRRGAPPELVQQVEPRFRQLLSAIPDLKKGDQITITYVPNQGTTLESKSSSMTLPGHDFQRAIFSIWLGSDPGTARIKRELLSP